MKEPSPLPPSISYRLSAGCFVLPLFFLLCCAFLQNTPAETVGVWGLVLCGLASPFACGALFFKPSPFIRHALFSFLVGVGLAMVLGVWGASIAMSGAQWHG